MKRLDCGLVYRGEGLPNMALKVLHRLVKQGRERVWLTGEEKAVILEQNEHKCALCLSRGPFEWDHIARHSESYGEQVFQNLCPQCHREKTELRLGATTPTILPATWRSVCGSNMYSAPGHRHWSTNCGR